MDQQLQIPAAEGGNGQNWEISQAYMIQSSPVTLKYTALSISSFCWLKDAYTQHWHIVIYKSALYYVHTAQSQELESNPGHLAWATSALPLIHDSWTTINPHNPLYVLHRWYWMPQSYTWQPISMCHRTPLGVDRNFSPSGNTHAEWFSHSKFSEHLASCWK